MRYFFLLILCVGFISILAAQPVITDFAPKKGPAGSNITISGLNFSATPTANTVYFGAVKAVVTSASPTSLQVTVPLNATYNLLTVIVNGLTAYSKDPFILTFPGAGPAFTASSFNTHEDFQLVGAPDRMKKVDLDGDNKIDLLSLNAAMDECTKVINKSSPGALSFSMYPNRKAGDSPSGVDYSDIDGDGKQDVVFSNFDGRNLWVLRNISTPGNPAFEAEKIFDVSNYPSDMAIHDMDGDGKPDIMLGQLGSIAVLRNTSVPGTISFAPVSVLYYSGSPNGRNIILQDFDGDKKADVGVWYGTTTNYFDIFRNTSTTGAVSFSAPVQVAASAGIIRLTAGDLDEDGMADIIAADQVFNRFFIYRNTGTVGTISFAPPSITATVGEAPTGVAIGDLDGDGKADVAIGTFDVPNPEPVVAVYKNQSTPGSIVLAAPVKYATLAPIVFDVNIADMDGDGKPDIVTGCHNVNKFSVLRNMIGCINAIINLQPANNSVCETANTSFSIDALNATGYQWQLNNGSGWVNITDNSIYAGATTSVLSVTGAAITMNNYKYRCVISQSCGVINSLEAILTVNPASMASVSISADRTAVCGTAPITFKAVPVNGGTLPSYQWKKNTIPAGTNSDTYIDNAPMAGDVITCELTSNATIPCLVNTTATSNAITLTTPVLPGPVDLGPDKNACTGQSVTLDAGTVYASYVWQDGSPGNSFVATTGGKYYVDVTDACGNLSSDTIAIIFNPLPKAFLPKDTTVCPYNPVTLSALQSYDRYLWNTGDISPAVIAAGPGLYWLEVKDNNGCTGRDSIHVLPKDCLKGLFVPNAFTPDGNGRNDLFHAFLYGTVKFYDMKIFNRYGELVFHSKNPSKGWDGNYKGKKHNPGTLVWQCSYQVDNQMKNTETGTLLLLR